MAELTVDMTYGEALFEAARDVNKVDLILEESQGILELFNKEPDFFEFIKTPVISAAEKKEVLANVFSGNICEELFNFMYVLIDKRRTKEFKNIIGRYKQLIDQSNGYSVGTIFSVEPLSNDHIFSFEEQTGRLLQKKVKLENKTDSNLVGGVRIFIEGKVIDASIRKRLKDLSESLR